MANGENQLMLLYEIFVPVIIRNMTERIHIMALTTGQDSTVMIFIQQTRLQITVFGYCPNLQ